LGAFPEYEMARAELSAVLQGRVDEMVGHVGLEPIADTLRSRKALPGLCSPLEAVIAVCPPDGRTPVPTILSYLHTVRLDWGVPKRLDETAEDILKDLNCGLVVGRLPSP
jgi:hypothetical protein